MRTKMGLPAFLAAAVTVAACAGILPSASAPRNAEPCLVTRVTGVPPDTVVVAIPHAVDFRHAPAPATDAERLVFAAFYNTLLNVDCEGSVHPGLADRWVVDGGGRRVAFTLRGDARFWDGTPVTTHAVTGSWLAGAGTDLGIDSVQALDSRSFVVWRSRPDSTPLHLFADPRLAIALPSDGYPVPMGTGPLSVAERRFGTVTAQRVRSGKAVVQFDLASGTDPRDLLERGADLIVTDDPATLEYAARRDAFEVIPLPWARTYVLQGVGALEDGGANLRRRLVHSVRADARVAEPPFWWTGARPCGPPGGEARPPRSSPVLRVAHLAGDHVAEDLASRLVALARAGQAPGGGGLRSAELAPDAMQAALHAQSEYAYVLAIPRNPYSPCGRTPAAGAVALVDARYTVVARRGRVRLVLEWDGAPRLVVDP